MAFSISFKSTTHTTITTPTSTYQKQFSSFPVSISVWVSNRKPLRFCLATNKPQTGPPIKKQSSSSTTNTKKKTRSSNKKKQETVLENWGLNDDVEVLDGEVFDDDDDDDGGQRSYSKPKSKTRSSSSSTYHPPPLPKPPAGFVVDETGRVLMASNKRIATIVDSTNNSPLECVVRRVFTSSRGDECLLLCPVDTPVQILKSKNIDGWSAVNDEEVEAIIPTAAYALAKIHMHLVHSGFCYTARGGFCYTEDDIFDFRTDDGQDVEGLPTEGVEITCFHQDGAHYMIYTPSDPVLFVAVKDESGHLQIADDDLLDDPAIISAIDEETEFNALVEEEAALLESLLGER